MSDGDSIPSQVTDQIKDIGITGVKDATEHIKPKVFFKDIVGQITGSKIDSHSTPEEKLSQEAEKSATAGRLSQIEEEIKRIAAERAKLTGPEIPGATGNTNEDLMHIQSQPKAQPNLQVTLAQTKGETGRGAKG